MIVGFGLAVSPLEEDREAIAYDMQSRGYGPEVMAKAMQIADAAFAEFQKGDRPGVIPGSALYYHTRSVSPQWSYRTVTAPVFGSIRSIRPPV